MDKMSMRQYFISPDLLTQPWLNLDQPLALIDLANGDAGADTPQLSHPLPPIPIIAIGDDQHPLAAKLDMVLPSANDAHYAVRNIEAHPSPAALLVQLLRHMDPQNMPQALLMESISYSMLQASTDHQKWLETKRPSPPLPHGQVRAERTDNGLHILLDRPDGHNQIDRHMRDALRELFELAALDDDIHHIRLTSTGRSFCLGAELSEFGTTRDPLTAHQIRLATLPAHAIAACAHKLEVHIQGACVGSGLEMAAFARHITASPQAWFHLPELAMGLIPGAGGCVSVSRRIGRHKAAQLILSGRRISADTALQWGLIDALIGD